jgi:hypothetical protein
MQVRVFSIPMEGDEDAQEDLNRFLRGHKVLSIDKVAVVAQGRQFWSICVEYLPRRIGDSSVADCFAPRRSERPRHCDACLTDASFLRPLLRATMMR